MFYSNVSNSSFLQPNIDEKLVMTNVIRCKKKKLININDFEKPKCSLHNYFPVFEVHCNIHIEESDPLSKGKTIIEANQHQLIKQVGDNYRFYLKSFIAVKTVEVIENYNTTSIIVIFGGNWAVTPTNIISNYGYVAIANSYTKYNNDPSLVNLKDAFDVFQKVSTESNPPG